MRITPLAVLGLALFGLNGCNTFHKDIPETSMADIPPERIEEISNLRDRVDAVDDAIAMQERKVTRAEQDLATEKDRTKALEDRYQAEEDLKRVAVERGDADLAARADENRADARDRLDAAKHDRSEADHVLKVDRAKLEELKAEKKYREADLELGRASAIHDDGGKIDINAYRDDTEQRRLDWEQAKRRTADVEGEAPIVD